MQLINGLLAGLSAALLMPSLGAQAASIGVHAIVDSSVLAETPAMSETVYRSELDRLIVKSNEYYANSGLDLRLYLTRVDFRNITNNKTLMNADTIVGNMLSQAGVFAGIRGQSDSIGSDVVVAITPNGLQGSISLFGSTTVSLCGKASSIPVDFFGLTVNLWDNGYLVLNDSCGVRGGAEPVTLIHEIGHLMGLGHGAKAVECVPSLNGDTSLYAFGKGYGIGTCGTSQGWRDIMLHNYTPNFTQVPFFSNPRIKDSRCTGTTDNKCGDENNGDAARALDLYKDVFAARSFPDVDQLAFPDPALKSCAQRYAGAESNELTTMDCSSIGIRNLYGMSQMLKMANLSLQNNNIFRVSELTNLNGSNLQQINLQGNTGIDCNELTALNQKFPGKILTPSSCFSSASLPAALGLILL